MIYIVNGAPGAGKTTFETNIQKCMSSSFCYILSTVDFVKEIAKNVAGMVKRFKKSKIFIRFKRFAYKLEQCAIQ